MVDAVLIAVGGGEITPAVVELGVVVGDGALEVSVKIIIVESRETTLALEVGGDGSERDDEIAAEVGLEAVDETLNTGERHGLLNIEIHSLEAVGGDGIVELAVVVLEGTVIAGVKGVSAPGTDSSSADHAHDLDTGILKLRSLAPESLERSIIGRVVVENDRASGVDVERANDQVGKSDTLLLDQGKHGNGVTIAIVGSLEVDDETGERAIVTSNDTGGRGGSRESAEDGEEKS